MPVVRKTGGLNDTVFDINDDIERAHASGMDPNGFSFVGADAAGLDYALNRQARLSKCREYLLWHICCWNAPSISWKYLASAALDVSCCTLSCVQALMV